MDFINEFVVDLAYVRNYSKNTVDSYRNDIEQFYELMNNKALDKITTEDIRGYIKHLSTVSEKSLARKLSTLRTFYDFMVKKSYLAVSPMDSIEGPKIGNQTIIFLFEIGAFWSFCIVRDCVFQSSHR